MKSKKLYSTKQIWKVILSIIALLIIGLSLWYTNYITTKIQKEERLRVEQWSETVKKQAQLVNLTNQTFEQLKAEETDKIEDWIAALEELQKEHEDYTFIFSFVKKVNEIPKVVEVKNFTDKEFHSSYSSEDLSFDTVVFDSQEQYEDSLKSLCKEWDKYNQKITLRNTSSQTQIIHYGNSKLFKNLKEKSDSLIQSFENDLITSSASIPILYMDSATHEIKKTINIEQKKIQDSISISQTIKEMESKNDKTTISFGNKMTGFIYFSESNLLKQLRYYPFIQIIIIFFFLLVSYFLFSTFRKAEQNQVWAGMAKETAHQLGTPLSSLMAWLEIIKADGVPESSINEMNKDINRLNTITDRFSKIGSTVKTKEENIFTSVSESTNYLRSRVSKKVELIVKGDKNAIANINTSLFEWVIENLTKNSIDAIRGNKGSITYFITDQDKKVIIDISDTGKGIPSSNFKSIFQPGFSTKERGWGLGLSLAKRIMKEQLKGKIFVLNSKIDQGTTFRIILTK